MGNYYDQTKDGTIAGEITHTLSYVQAGYSKFEGSGSSYSPYNLIFTTNSLLGYSTVKEDLPEINTLSEIPAFYAMTRDPGYLKTIIAKGEVIDKILDSTAIEKDNEINMRYEYGKIKGVKLSKDKQFIPKLWDRPIGYKDLFIEDPTSRLAFLLIDVGFLSGGILTFIFNDKLFDNVVDLLKKIPLATKLVIK